MTGQSSDGNSAAASATASAWRALRYRDFRLVAFGNMISQLGFWGQYVAVGWAARSLTDSDFLVASAFAAPWLPTLFLSPIAGVFADRYDRRMLVMVGNLAMVVPPAVIGILIQTDQISFWRLVALVVVGGVGQTLTQPATAAFVPALVPLEDLHSAISLNSGMQNSTRVVGPSIGGALITAWGVAWGFHINAISFLAVAGACLLVRARPARAVRVPTRMLADLRLGFAYTRRNPAVARLISFSAFVSFWLMHSALMPIIARDVLHGGVSIYGLLSAAPGVGFVGAALVTPLLTTMSRRLTAMMAASFGVGFSLLLIALSRSIPLTVIALGLFGLTFMTVNTLITTMLLTASQDEYRGRVMGVFAMFSIGVFPINSVLAGALAAAFGAANTVLLCSVAILVFVTAFVVSGSLGVIRRAADPAPASPAQATSKTATL